MREGRRLMVAVVALGILVLGSRPATAAERERLSKESFAHAQELTKLLVKGATPERSFRMSQQDIGEVLKKRVLSASLQKQLAGANQAGAVQGVLLNGITYQPSATPGVLLLFEHGSVTGVFVPDDVWQSSDEGDDDGGEEPEFTRCPWYVCMIRGAVCDCEEDRIDVPAGESCPAVDTDCCKGYSCNDSGPGVGNGPPAVDTIFD